MYPIFNYKLIFKKIKQIMINCRSNSTPMLSSLQNSSNIPFQAKFTSIKKISFPKNVIAQELQNSTEGFDMFPTSLLSYLGFTRKQPPYMGKMGTVYEIHQVNWAHNFKPSILKYNKAITFSN